MAKSNMKSKAMKRILKMAIIKAGAPKEKREEILGAIEKLDLKMLTRNPDALAEVMSDPTKLSNYVVEEQNELVDNADKDVAVLEESESDINTASEDTEVDSPNVAV